jgi:hypothetical protein
MSKISPRSKNNNRLKIRRLGYEAIEPRILLAGIGETYVYEPAAEGSLELQLDRQLLEVYSSSINNDTSLPENANDRVEGYQTPQIAEVTANHLIAENVDRTLTLDFLSDRADFDFALHVLDDADGGWQTPTISGGQINFTSTAGIIDQVLPLLGGDVSGFENRVADQIIIPLREHSSFSGVVEWNSSVTNSGRDGVNIGSRISVGQLHGNVGSDLRLILQTATVGDFENDVEIDVRVDGITVGGAGDISLDNRWLAESGRVQIMVPENPPTESKMLDVGLAATRNDSEVVELSVAAANLSRLPQHMLSANTRDSLLAIAKHSDGEDSQDSSDRRLALNGIAGRVQQVSQGGEIELIELADATVRLNEMNDITEENEIATPGEMLRDHASVGTSWRTYVSLDGNFDLEIAIDRVFSDQEFEFDADLVENEESGSTESLIVRAAVGTVGASFLIYDRPAKHFAFRGARLLGKAVDKDGNGNGQHEGDE